MPALVGLEKFERQLQGGGLVCKGGFVVARSLAGFSSVEEGVGAAQLAQLALTALSG